MQNDAFILCQPFFMGSKVKKCYSIDGFSKLSFCVFRRFYVDVNRDYDSIFILFNLEKCEKIDLNQK
jgi:hypothetical protein